MARSRYKRHSRGGRFRQQGDGLRAAVDTIRQQRQIEIDALKRQEIQQSEVSKMQISGMSNVARVESDNRQILQNLEDKVYSTKRQAITKRGQREVENLLGKAQVASNEAKYWQDFATNHAKKYGELATGLTEFAAYRAAVVAYEKLTQEQKDNFKNFEHASYTTIEQETGDAANQVVDLSEKRDIIAQVSGLGNNHHLHRMLANDFIQTYQNRLSFIQQNSYTEEGKNLYNKDNLGQLLLNDAYLYMSKFDIPFHSQAGQKILQMVNRNITAETIAYANSAALQQNALDLREALQVINGFFPTRNDSEETQEEWTTKLNNLRILVQGSAIEGDNNTISLPNDANRKNYKPIDYWRVTIDYLVDNIDFTDVTELDALDILTSDDGQPSLFTRFPELRAHAEEKLREKIKNQSEVKRDRKEFNFVQELNTRFIAPFNASLESGDFSETVLNKQWREEAFNYLVNNKKLLTETNVAASEAAKSLFEIIMYNPSDYGSTEGWSNDNFELINNANEALLSSNFELALFYLSQHDGELPANFKNLHPSITAALKVQDFNSRLDAFLINSFKDSIPFTPAPSGVENTLPVDLIRISEVARGRFMEIWASKSDVVDPGDRFIQTQNQLTEEIRLGIERGEGLFAATRNTDATINQKYLFNILDTHGGVAFPNQVKDITSEISGTNENDGWYGSAVTTEESTYLTVPSPLDFQETVTMPFDVDLDLPTVEGLPTIEGINPFQLGEEPEKDSDLYEFAETVDPIVQRNTRVRGLIDANLSRMISESNALFLLDQIQRGKADYQDLEQLGNLAEFIKETKKHYPSMTTKEIMDIFLDSIYRNGDTVWKSQDDKDGTKRGINDQFEGVTWPLDMASFCAALTGTSCTGDQNSFTNLLLYQLKQSGVNVQDLFRHNILTKELK